MTICKFLFIWTQSVFYLKCKLSYYNFVILNHSDVMIFWTAFFVPVFWAKSAFLSVLITFLWSRSQNHWQCKSSNILPKRAYAHKFMFTESCFTIACFFIFLTPIFDQPTFTVYYIDLLSSQNQVFIDLSQKLM